MFLDQQRKHDTGLFSEEAGVVLVAEPDCGDAGSSAFELRLVLAQLRDVLAAEDSAVVPQKSHYRGRFRPNRSQRDLIVVGIRQAYACKPRA